VSEREPLLTRSFALLMSGQLCQSLGYATLPLLPLYLASIDASRTEIGVAMAAASIGGLLVRPLVGWALDTLGRRPTMVVGTLFLALGTSMVAMITSMNAWIYIDRVIFGIGIAALFTGYFTFAADIIPASRRTEGIALFGIAGLLPLTVNPIVEIFGVTGSDLRWFFPVAGFVILASVGFLIATKEPTRTRPLVPLTARTVMRALRARPLWSVWLATILFAGLVAVFFAFATVAGKARGIPNATWLWFTYAGGAIGVRVFGARLPDYVGTHNMVAPALASYTAAMLLVASAGTTFDLLIAGLLAGLGHGYCFPVVTGQVITRAGDDVRGMAVAMFTGLWDCALLVMTPVFGLLSDAFDDAVMFAIAAIWATVGLAGWLLLEWGQHEPGHRARSKTVARAAMAAVAVGLVVVSAGCGDAAGRDDVGELRALAPASIMTFAHAPVTLHGEAVGGVAPIAYAWSFDLSRGDQVDAHGSSVEATYRVPGAYQARLEVVDARGVRAVADVTVEVQVDREPPRADAGGDRVASVGVPLRFSAAASTDNVGIVSYQWDFDLSTGSGFDAEGVEVVTSYPRPGTYFVALQVRDAAGNVDATLVRVEVAWPPDTTPPQAEVASPRWAHLGASITLDGSASTDDRGIDVYRWVDVTDETQTAAGVPIDGCDGPLCRVRFDHLGEAKVRLTVRDAAGNEDAADVEIFVIVDEEPPVARLDGPTEVQARAPVTFDASASTDNTEIASFHWLVDGAPTCTNMPSCTIVFREPGRAHVEVRVEDVAALSDRVARDVEVGAPVTQGLWITPNPVFADRVGEQRTLDVSRRFADGTTARVLDATLDPQGAWALAEGGVVAVSIGAGTIQVSDGDRVATVRAFVGPMGFVLDEPGCALATIELARMQLGPPRARCAEGARALTASATLGTLWVAGVDASGAGFVGFGGWDEHAALAVQPLGFVPSALAALAPDEAWVVSAHGDVAVADRGTVRHVATLQRLSPTGPLAFFAELMWVVAVDTEDRPVVVAFDRLEERVRDMHPGVQERSALWTGYPGERVLSLEVWGERVVLVTEDRVIWVPIRSPEHVTQAPLDGAPLLSARVDLRDAIVLTEGSDGWLRRADPHTGVEIARVAPPSVADPDSGSASTAHGVDPFTPLWILSTGAIVRWDPIEGATRVHQAVGTALTAPLTVALRAPDYEARWLLPEFAALSASWPHEPTDLDGLWGPPQGGTTRAANSNVDQLVTIPNGGQLTIALDGVVVRDGPGPDIRIFENPFHVSGDAFRRWMEPATVEVSADGVQWHAFPVERDDARRGDGMDPRYYVSGFVGIESVLADPLARASDVGRPQAGGDAFDLADVGLSEVRYIRINDVPDDGLTPDIDAVVLIHWLYE